MAIFFDHRVQAPYPGECHEFQWHKTHSLLAVASYNPSTGAAVTIYQEEGEPLSSCIIRKTKKATVLSWHPTKKVVAVGWETGEVTAHNCQDNENYDIPRVHKTEITIMHWSSNGSRLLSGDVSGMLVMWKGDPYRGRVSQPLSQIRLEEHLTQVILRPPPAVDTSIDLASLARAAVSGDESALDMFSWHQGKGDSKVSLNPLGPQESLAFFVGGANGSVFYIDEDCKTKRQFIAEGPVRKLLYYDEKNVLVTVTENLMLTLHSVSATGDTAETLKVKLNGKPDKADLTWAGKGVLATTAGEKFIRMWDLERNENYILGLKAAEFSDVPESITCIAYCAGKGVLACGTSAGKIALWKYSPAAGANSPEPEDQWQSQTPSSVNGVILELTFGATKNLLAVNTLENVYILTEQRICAQCRGGTAVVQTGATQLSIDSFNENTGHHDLKTDIQVKGVAVTKDALAVTDGRRIVVYEITGGNPPFRVAGNFSSTTPFLCLHEQTVYTVEPGKILAHNYQGTVKQLLPLPDNSDEVVSLEICSQYLVVATAAGAVKVFDLSRREAKSQAGPRYLQSSIVDFGRIVSAKCNANATRVSVIIDKVSGTHDDKIYVWDVEMDLVQFFNFMTGCDEADDDSKTAPAAGDDGDATMAERGKRQTARDIAGRRPLSHFWDWEEPRLLVCEAQYVATVKDSADNKSAAGAQQPSYLSAAQKSKKEEIVDTIVVSLLVTSEHGFLVQDNFPIEAPCSRLIALEIPFYYFVKELDKSDAISDNSRGFPTQMATLSTSAASLAMVIQRVHRDFVGLERAEKSAKTAMMDFSFYLTLGDMDEAFKAIKVIKSDSVWENMAKMCVKTRRLDVARVCLGNMRHTRALMSLREFAKEPEIDARVAVLAIQLGLFEDAERLLKNCKRYDLLNDFYQCRSEWEKALATAELYDRIHLRTTSYNFAKYLESQGRYAEAIQYFEKSNTHRHEVPKMLFEDSANLENYVIKSRDKVLFKWWAQFMESSGELDIAMKYYQEAQDYLSLVRVYCFRGETDKASAVCNETGDRAACYHVARQYETIEQYEQAIHFFTRAQAYGNAIRLCREHGFDDKLMNMALLGRPDDQVEAARYYEFKPGQEDKAVMLYHKAGYFSKALELAFSTKQYAALHTVSESLDERTDPQLLQRCADFFIENSQYDRAVDLLATARRYWDALKLCMEQHVPMTEELVEKLTPSGEAEKLDADERNKILEGIGEVCMRQRQYHLATKKFTQCGNRVKAMKALLKSGDTEKIVFFANVSRQKEIYVMAGHYLQTLDWQKDPEIMKNIIGFYTKGRAMEPLAGFYDACAQVEIDEFQNYEKALGALGESYKVLSKLSASDSSGQEMKLNDLKNRMILTKKFLDIKSAYERDPENSVKQCRALLNEPDIDRAVRYGDLYGMMIEHLARAQQWKAAYNCLEDLRSRVPKVNPAVFVDRRMLEAIHRAVNVPLKDVAPVNGTTNFGKTNGSQQKHTINNNASDDEAEGEILDEEVDAD